MANRNRADSTMRLISPCQSPCILGQMKEENPSPDDEPRKKSPLQSRPQMLQQLVLLRFVTVNREARARDANHGNAGAPQFGA